MLLWKLPRTWTAPSVVDRAALYPALWLAGRGETARVRLTADAADLGGCKAMIMLTDAPLEADELALLESCEAAGAAAAVFPQAGLADADVATIGRLGAQLVLARDPRPLASEPARPGGAPASFVEPWAARRMEDALVRRSLGQAGAEPFPDGGAGGVVILASDEASLEDIAPALAARGLLGSPEVLTCVYGAGAADVPGRIGADDAALLARLASADLVICAHGRAPAASLRPGAWTRTALFHGAPVIASSHPSLDGLADLCVLDDWERGLELRHADPSRLRLLAARAQRALAGAQASGAMAEDWRRALDEAAALRMTPPAARAARRPRAPRLKVLLDLSQDIDVLMPILQALRERGVAELDIEVTDWLRTESPRTLAGLEAAGFPFALVSRKAVRAGEIPTLDGVDGVLTASDTTVGPHRSCHSLASRATQAGLPTFTLQHGFENIGLTYRDESFDASIRFASRRVFTWGPEGSLPDWVCEETRRAVVPTGSPKRTPSPAPGAMLGDGMWRRVIGVFENLHWERFDDLYRRRFLDDLAAMAEANLDTLVLVKPHHAGRWLIRNRQALRVGENLVVIDPLDPEWQPFTAPQLMASMQAVITTPSTVALDAAHAGRRVAVVGYDQDLGLYAPLPVIRATKDWLGFAADRSPDFLGLNEAFLRRHLLPGCADHRIAGRIEAELAAGRVGAGRSVAA